MEFDTTDRRQGLSIYDPVETARFELYTPTAVEPKPAPTDDFYFPVDSAVEFETATVEVPKLVSTVVRNQDGEMLADAPTSETQTFDAGAYLVELQSTPMKLYLTVEGALTVKPLETSVRVDFGAPRRVRVGARSFHERPVGTITVTDDVRDEMAALSLLGSALKTTTCERSFPTLRGHPPVVERGDQFDVPPDVEEPDTGVKLVVPPERESVYPLASLAYYLGAELIPGSDPRLVAGDFEHSLNGPGGYEATVNRTLKHVFFLDCLTRTEGYYPVTLHEREQVEPLVELDFETLYNQPIADQLPAYLSVPFEVLEPHCLDWHLTTDVVPASENFPALPYFADDLSLLRTAIDPETHSTGPKVDEVDSFMRRSVPAGDFTRRASDPSDTDDEIVHLDPTETVEHAWVGEGYPLGANKVTLDSLRRQADRTPPDESAIEVHVVCNDRDMADENEVGEFYGLRDFVTYDVTIHHDLATDELADLFESSADFLHYIGHVDETGFWCRDGYFDANTLDTVGVDAFLLNACRSYEQGATLVEKGSIGGVVTTSDVLNSSATKVGRALARLLNAGFSLRSALDIATDEALVTVEYFTIGDGGLTLCQGAVGVPTKFYVEKDEHECVVRPVCYATSTHSLGTVGTSLFEGTKNQHIVSGSLDKIRTTEEELQSIIGVELVPVEIEGELRWSDELSSPDSRDRGLRQ